MKLLRCGWAKSNTCEIHLLMVASRHSEFSAELMAFWYKPKSLRICWLSAACFKAGSPKALNFVFKKHVVLDFFLIGRSKQNGLETKKGYKPLFTMSLEGWILSVNRVVLWVAGKFAEALWLLACLSFHHICSLLFQVLLCCPFCPLLWQSCSCHHGWKHLSWMCCFFFFFLFNGPGSSGSLRTGAAWEQRCSVLQTLSILTCWELPAWLPEQLRGFCSSYSATPMYSVSRDPPSDSSKACKSLATLSPQTTSSSRKHFLLSETEMGRKGVFRGLWYICCFLQLRALCKCSLRHPSRIWCSKCVFGLCFILSQSISVMIYEKNKNGQG